jgi:dTDP-4-amino-4,6-dideoxygalactose transaminase
MSKEIESCENKLSSLLGRKYCILTGRGASALWIAYKIARPQKSHILLPATLCLSPVFTVFYADKTPLFVDVRKQDATIDPKLVEKMLAANKEIAAVVAVHLYGQPAAMAELEKICRKYKVMLIEDVAQAFGCCDGSGKPYGTSGDVSIVSFGHTKILDVGGGGAILTDDKETAMQARALESELEKQIPDNAGALSEIYSRLFYAIWESGKTDERCYQLFDQFPALFQSLYLYRITPELAKIIEDSFEQLPDIISHRKKIAKIYHDTLASLPQVETFDTNNFFIPWRYSLLVSQNARDALLDEVRSKGFDISSWYPNIQKWFFSGRAQKESFKVANEIEKKIINLWVTPDYSIDKAESLAKLIRSFLELQ